jgi:membrane-associated phospholipid phosphatase
MLACVYRPWVLSNKIHPSKLAVPFAKGYSFPSGHSAMSSSVLGGTAFILRRKPIICILLICLILLIGFSRLWLGVHTPQDVVCGLLIGLASIFIVDRIINYAEKRQNRYLILALILNITVALILLYICRFNTYRTDYVSGELLVNPAKSIYSTVVIYGYLLGLLNGAFLCRRFFPFDPHKTTIKNRITIGIIGSIFIVAGLKNIVGYIIMNELPTKIVFLAMFITGLFITLLYPIIFKSIDKNL